MRFYLLICCLSLLLCCTKEDVIPSQTDLLVGTWKIEANILEDGTREPAETTYALLEYTYSDGFIIYEDRETGNSMWFGSINDVDGERFRWKIANGIWTITVLYSDNTTKDFAFTITNLTESGMDLTTPKGHQYHLGKE